jgi:glycine/D-amino acid oxidase-like deaminating enzyme
MAFTPDGLPLIGPLDPDRRVWFCGGFNGHGMSLARRCARACAVEMLDGERSPFPLSRFVEAAPIDQEQG